ncbi:hypothetical protein SAMN05443572_1011275 [Myxococcus fulvus]|uniref:Uncharacterized protein n=1 Tax=Myxococcus fulvus TaxID=33 RepID=A0ABY1BYN3_MYXFU|nr:hypothetical protein SAMN05443572_1011275 [Myxococcus fulvus]
MPPTLLVAAAIVLFPVVLAGSILVDALELDLDKAPEQ